MNKLVRSFLVLSLLVVLPLGVAAFNGRTTEGNNNTLTLKGEQWAAEQEKLKESQFGKAKVTEELQPNFYENSYAKATESQKQELKSFMSKENVKLTMTIGNWLRPIMIITGDLIKDTPRLSLRQAKDLYHCNEWVESSMGLEEWESALANEFNKIAAPRYFVWVSNVVI